MIDPNAAASDEGRVVRTLKEGYWDRIEVVERVDGTLRVRKSTRPDAPQGPWGITALRLEIRYLETLPERARGAFPPLLVCWDDSHALPPRVGYEVPFYADHDDAGHLARTGALTQPQVDDFQDRLAEILFEQVHAPPIQQVHAPLIQQVHAPLTQQVHAPLTQQVHAPLTQQVHALLTGGGTSLSAHVTSAIEHALELLEKEPPLEQLVGAETIELDGKPRWGTRAALARAVRRAETLLALDAAPQVRLHGDFFLENILFRRAASELGPQLLLIDPVSVAGVSEGSPLFDLVKYESYATGELFALRKGLVDVSGFEGGRVYRSSVRWEDPELAPFRLRDWHSRFRSRFNERYGASDRGAYHLIEGYFGVVMAVNTNGQQRRARLLGATRAFNLAADHAPTDNAPADNA